MNRNSNSERGMEAATKRRSRHKNRSVRLSGIRKGRFGFPPESHRPKSTYAPVSKMQVRGEIKLADIPQANFTGTNWPAFAKLISRCTDTPDLRDVNR